jgi:hypothetical protein
VSHEVIKHPLREVVVSGWRVDSQIQQYRWHMLSRSRHFCKRDWRWRLLEMKETACEVVHVWASQRIEDADGVSCPRRQRTYIH